MKIKFLLLFTLFACSTVLAQQGTHTKQHSPQGVYYWEYLPLGYDPAGSTKYPLMIFLHGCGEIAYRSGSDCPPQNTYTSTPLVELDKLVNASGSIPKLIAQGNTMCYTIDGVQQCFIVISPQLGNGMSGTAWDPRKLDDFIEEIKTLYPAADQKSIYLTGLSLGGIGTWRYAERHPDKLAAYVPISGNSGGDPASLACNLSMIPVWAFHDDPDPTVPTYGTTTMENRIKACSNHIVPQVTLIENYTVDANGVATPKAVHGAWGTAYSSNPSPANTTTRIIVERPSPVPDGTTVYSWMLSHHRTALGPLVNVAPDKTVTTATTTVTATTSHPEAGATITSYLWELASTETNPPTLTDQTTPTVSISGLKNEHGNCTFRLTVTDNQGYKDTDEIIIKVQIPAGNAAPTANAGDDRAITLPKDSVIISGKGTDSDGTIASYAWTQVNGATATLSGANTQILAVDDLVQGSYTFRLTVTDNGGATGSDDVVVDVAAAPPTGTISWNSYNVVTQATPTQPGVVTGTDNNTQATLEFYQSTNVDGVAEGALFTTFNSGAHPQTGANLSAYWANGTGNKYPHAGKSTVARGSDTGETNAPSPTGVYDLQLHPPSTDYLCVAAFVVPLSGEYTLSNVAVRRVSSSGANVRLRVFNPSQTQILDLLATNNRAWVQSPDQLSLVNLTAGDRIYFGIDREDTYASDFAEIAWTITWIPPNVPPTAHAGDDENIALPENSTTLNGSAGDTDGTVISYAWTQISGPSTATLTDADKLKATVSGLIEGSYIFRFTATDDDGATAFDDVIVTVLPAPSIISWNSYDVVTQATPTQQGVVTSTDNSTQATLEFYQSTNLDGVTKGTLFTTFNSGAHPQTGANLSAYWANGTGNKYPHAGKSTVARGSDTGETNAPQPAGVFDLQLHPPSTDYLAVAAFIAPVDGAYTVSNVAVRRVSNLGANVSLKVFNSTQTLILSLVATNNRAWVQSTDPLSLGNLAAGDRIYFAADREDTYASDFAEIAWTVNVTPGAGNSSARSKPAQSATQNTNTESVSQKEESILFYPNPVKNTIYLQGLKGETDIRIFNMIGVLVQQNKVDQNTSALSLQPGLFPPGFYTMILESQGTRRYFRFLKE